MIGVMCLGAAGATSAMVCMMTSQRMLFPTSAFTLAVIIASCTFGDNGFFAEALLPFFADAEGDFGVFGDVGEATTVMSSKPNDGIGTDMSAQTPEAAIGDDMMMEGI